ncbi:hypothetical protein SAMN03097719_1767 [Pantoea ananatis]|nr:hypothetical protein SAMN03097719_1767 [Pantoea ananatis]
MKNILVLNILALLVAICSYEQKNFFEFVIFSSACFVNVGSILLSPLIYIVFVKGDK